MAFLYIFHVAALLFFSGISTLTHSMEITQQLPSKKVTFQFINDNDIKREYDLNVLKTSTTLKNMFEDFGEIQDNRPIEIAAYRAKEFDIIYQGMEQLVTDDKDHTKKILIHAIYKNQLQEDLITALSTTNKLDIPPLTNIIISCMAQKIDNLSHAEQNSFLHATEQHVAEPALLNAILSRITTRTPLLKEVPLTQDDYVNDTHVFSPCKKLKINKQTGDVINCSSDETIISNHDRSEYFFEKKCVISPTGNYMLYLGNDNTAQLIDINNPKNPFVIKNIIWRGSFFPCKKSDKNACFNNDGTRLFIHTYNPEDPFSHKRMPDDQCESDTYKIIDTSTGRSVKTINNDPHIHQIYFCATNRLCMEYTNSLIHVYGDGGDCSLKLMNTDDDKRDMIFNNFSIGVFDETKKTLVMYSRNFSDATVTIYDIEKNCTKEITLDITLDHDLYKPSIVFNKDNTTFLIQGKRANNDQVLLYDPEKKSLNHLLNFTDSQNLTINWSASGDYIIYMYANPCNYKNRIGYVRVSDFQGTQFKIAPYDPQIHIHIHPEQDIVYVLDVDTRSTGALEIYDLSTGNLISSYDATDFHSTRTGSRRTPERFLSADGKLLIIPTAEKWILINTKTSTLIAEWPKENYRIFWKNEYLMVEKSNALRSEYILDKKYSINDRDFENNTVVPKITLPDRYTKYYIGGGVVLTIASLIAAYIYYPELFKKLSCGH